MSFPPVVPSPWGYRIMDAARKLIPRMALPVVFLARVVGRDFDDASAALYGADTIETGFDPAVDGVYVAELRTNAQTCEVLRIEVLALDSARAPVSAVVPVFVSTGRVLAFDLAGPTDRAVALFGRDGPTGDTIFAEGRQAATPGVNAFFIHSGMAVEFPAWAPLFLGQGQRLNFFFAPSDLQVGAGQPFTLRISVMWREPEPPAQ